MPASADGILREVLVLSQRMHHSAKAELWEEVRQLYDERSQQIESCFSPAAVFANRDAAATKIQEIIQLDRQIMDLGVDAKRNLAESIGQLLQGRSAINTYQRFSR